MANTAFIIEEENIVIDAKNAIKALGRALQWEKEEKCGDERVNRECWATAILNIRDLNKICEEFLKQHGN